MRAEVFRRKPEFAELVSTWGSKTLLQYYTQGFAQLAEPSQDILTAISSEVSTILGPDTAAHARDAVVKQKWVNTADHHGLLHHPYFYSTSLALSNKSVALGAQATVILPFGGVSLGNDSFPRGFSFHDNDVALQKIFFKSLKYRRQPVHALAPMSQEELIHEKQRSTSFSLSKTAHDRLQYFFDALINESRVWSQETYGAQLTVMNGVLWHQLFGNERGDFVYLEIDSVVRRLLLEKYIPNRTDIYNLIFERAWREKFIELFSGIQGSHDSDSGTHLFWYIDQTALTRRRLVINGGNLVTLDGTVAIPLKEETIAEGLRARKLMPSSALTLIIVQEVENLTCGGGPSQMHYLSSYTTQWAALLNHFGKMENKPKSIIWCGDCNLFSITNVEKNDSKSATLIDVLLYTEKRSQTVDTELARIELSSVVDAIIPTLYTIYTGQKTNFEPNYKIPTIEIK